MKVGIIGTGARAQARERAVSASAIVTFQGVLGATPLDAFLEPLDIVFVSAPTAEHFRIAEAATKRGVHVFLEWPPATSIRECQAIIELSEEAGVEVGVSRPLRHHPDFSSMPEGARASLILARWEIPVKEDAAWPRWLADAVDLCCALSQSSSVQRIDAEAVRNASAWPDAVAFGLRFHNSSYAQVSIRRSTGGAGGVVYAAGTGFEIEVALRENGAGSRAYVPEQWLVEAETWGFLQDLAVQRPARVSILDGLHTMRLVERLMKKLR